LSTNKVLTHLNPKPLKPEKNAAELELDAAMKELDLPAEGTTAYELAKKLKKEVDAYMDWLDTNDKPVRHMMFMAPIFRSIARILVEAAAKMDGWIGEQHGKDQ
jgi:hypothetical protein